METNFKHKQKQNKKFVIFLTLCTTFEKGNKVGPMRKYFLKGAFKNVKGQLGRSLN